MKRSLFLKGLSAFIAVLMIVLSAPIGTLAAVAREIAVKGDTIYEGEVKTIEFKYGYERIYLYFTPETTDYYKFYTLSDTASNGEVWYDDEIIAEDFSYYYDESPFEVVCKLEAGKTYKLYSSLYYGDTDSLDVCIEKAGDCVITNSKQIQLTLENPMQMYYFIPDVSGVYRFGCFGPGYVDGSVSKVQGVAYDYYSDREEGRQYYYFLCVLEAGETYKFYSELAEGESANITAFVKYLEIESVVLEDRALIEGNYSDTHYEYNEETGEYDIEWGSYSTSASGTVFLKDGSSFRFDDDYCEDGHFYCGFQTGYNQSYENQWKAGNTYTVETTFLGETYTYNIEIVENPIVSVTPTAPIKLIEGSDGHTSYYWDYENGISVEYIHYTYYPEFTILFSDGHEETVSSGDYLTVGEDQYYFDTWDDQNDGDFFEVGTNKARGSVCGFDFEFDVEVIECPVEKIEFEPISLIEGIDGYYVYTWANGGRQEYFKYKFEPTYTVYFEDGTTATATGNENIIYNGREYELEWVDDQSYENEWGCGTHTINASIMGYETSFDVVVEAFPIVDIIIEDINLIEGFHNHETYSYDENHQAVMWKRYSYEVYGFTIVFPDGREESHRIDRPVMIGGKEYYLTIEDDQAYNNEWGVGTHAVRAELGTFETTFNVIIEENPVSAIYVEKQEVIAGIDGGYNTSSMYDEHGNYIGETEWFEYGYYPEEYTVVFKDGTSQTVDIDRYIEYRGMKIFLSMWDDQDYDNVWGVGEHDVNVSFLGFKSTFTVEVIDTPISEVIVEKIEMIEGTNISSNTSCDEYGNEYTWESYYYYPEFTVIFKDGREETLGYWDSIFYDGAYYSVNMSDDQTPENVWGVGAHTANGSILGYDFTFTVEIVESPVEAILIDEIKLIENYDRNCSSSFPEYDENGDYIGDDYFEYYGYDVPCTVVFKDGNTVETTLHGNFEYNGEWYCFNYSDDQEPGNEWGVGTHTVEIFCLGYETNINVEIVENPVKSIRIEGVSLTEGLNTDEYHYYDEETDTYYPWICYSYYPECGVYFKDGHFEVISGDEPYYYSGREFWLSTWDDQSYDNEWGAGSYFGNASFMGVETAFPIFINECPVSEIIVEDISIVEGTGGYYEFDPESGEEWYCYEVRPEFTVVFSDGHSESFGAYDGVQIEDHYCNLDVCTEQSYDDQWGIGTYEVQAELLGVKTTFNVEITESPVKTLFVSDISFAEGTHGYYTWDYDENDNRVNWFCYSTFDVEYTVLFSDGHTETKSRYDSITIGGETYYLSIREDQSYDNQWGIGSHTAYASLMGVTAEFTVEITESPIVAFYVEDVSIVEKTGGSYYYNDEESWYRYDYSSEVTVLLNDGRTVSGYSHGVTVDGVDYSIACVDDQSYESSWGIGEHTVTAKLGSLETTFTVEIIETPVLGAVFTDLELYRGLNSYKNTRYNDETGEMEEYDHYEFIPGGTLLLKDGTVLTAENGYVTYNGESYWIDYFDNQHDDPWSVGQCTMDVSVLGYDGSINVDIKDNPYSALTISGERELILEFTKKNGGTERFEIESIRNGLLWSGESYFSFQTHYDDDVKLSEFDKGLVIEIGDLTSNTLDGNKWYKAWCVGSAFSNGLDCYFMHEEYEGFDIGIYDGFSGEVTEENAADITTLAVWIGENYEEWYKYERAVINGFNCWLIDRDEMSELIEEIFGITDFDFTKSSLYDPSNPDIIPVYEQMAGGRGGYETMSLNFENGEWIFEDTTEYRGFNGMKLIMDENGVVQVIELGILSSDEEEVVVSGDLDGDEEVTTKDVLAIRKALGGLTELTPEQEKAADVDGDGEVTTKDVLKIRKFLGGLIEEL